MVEQPGYTTAVELQQRLAAERRGHPFLRYRDGAGMERIVELHAGRERISIGRSPHADISLVWDADASAAHAELEQVVDVWTVIDDGLSRNGTFVNGERVHSRRRLSNGDSVRCGRTVMLYHDPAEASRERTAPAVDFEPPRISEAQRRVLISLTRPFRDGNVFATPATNPQIAAELHLSVDAVKTHIRLLFQKFAIENLPQNQKRARLAELALQTGRITESDFRPPERN